MTRRERGHLDTLRRRMLYLAERIAASDRDLSYDKQEIAAIKWALARLARSTIPLTRAD